MPSSKSKKRSVNRVVINVGGQKHETFISTLRTIPDTRLSYLSEHHTSLTKVAEYDSTKSEYFFDRHPGVFAQILNYYRTGKLHCPSDVCGPLFEAELEFWGIDEEQVEMCCWENYKQHRDKQEKLKYFRIPQEEQLEDAMSSRNSELFEEDVERPSRWARIRPQVWRGLDEPYSSSIAKAIGITSFVMFTAFIIKFALSTLPYFQERKSVGFMVLNIIHVITMAWFSMEFVLRAIFSPDKVEFLKRLLTWVDIISLVPMYMLVLYPRFWEEVPYLEMLVMMKVARIFQLFKLSYVIQVLTNTLKASSRELCLLLVIMGFQTVVFSSILYFLERKEKTKDYSSVPHSMWWTIITMTTVGYGDVYPHTWLGKIIGSACAICGVLVIALPVSVVATNFSLFYTYAKARLNIPPKKKRVALAHALTAMRIPRCTSDTGEPNPTGNPGSLNYPSICSTEGRRDTTTAHPTPVGSEMSLTPTSCQSAYRKFFKDSYHSLQSIASLRPPRITYNAGSRSLNSIPPELSKEQKEQKAREDIMFRLDPPTRASSFVDVSRSKAEEENKKTRANTGPKNEYLGIPCRRSTDDQLQDTALGLTPFLLPARLRMRRGAISMASLSLKSASSNSSYLHWPTSKEGLDDNGPFIILPTNFSLQSLSSIKSGISCSCSSLKSLAKETLHPFTAGNQSRESVITIPVPVLHQPPKTRTTSTSTQPDEAELERIAATNEAKHPPPESRSTTSVDSVLRQQDNSPHTTSDMVSEGDMVFLVFPAKVTEDADQDETDANEKESDSVRADLCACGGKTTTVPSNEHTGQSEDNNCKSGKLGCCDCDDKGNCAALNDAGVTPSFSSEGTGSFPCTEATNTDDSVFLKTPPANSVEESFPCHLQQNSSPKRSRCNATSQHNPCSELQQHDTENAVVCDPHFTHSAHNLSSPLQRQRFNSSDRCLKTQEKCSSPELLSNGCLRPCQQSRASCPVLISNTKYDEMSCVENPINCVAHSLQNDIGNSNVPDDARRLQLSRIPLGIFNRSPKHNGNYRAVSQTDHNLCDHYKPHLHADGEKNYGKSHTTSV